jgi:hypothetical protein
MEQSADSDFHTHGDAGSGSEAAARGNRTDRLLVGILIVIVGVFAAGAAVAVMGSPHPASGSNPVTYFRETGLPPSATAWNVTYDGAVNGSQSGLSPVWTITSAYPNGIDDHSCLADAGYLYCFGGSLGGSAETNAVDYARINSDGSLGSWAASPNTYPSSLYDMSCNPYDDRVYCVGGANSSGTSQRSVYYAPLLPGGGVGRWVSATPYPIPVHNHACRIEANTIYCVGGNSGANNAGEVNSTYYAAILPSNAVGNWTATTPYPIAAEDEACNVAGNDIYCTGVWSVGGSHTSASYYAPLSSNGIGAWTPTTPYPTPIEYDHKTCAVSDGYLYCAGGYASSATSPTSAVYYAPLTPDGLGAWLQGGNYAGGAWRSMSAASYNGFVYYVGGYNDGSASLTSGVFYASTDNTDFGSISFSAPAGDHSYRIPNQVVGGRTYFPNVTSGSVAAGGTVSVSFSAR